MRNLLSTTAIVLTLGLAACATPSTPMEPDLIAPHPPEQPVMRP